MKKILIFPGAFQKVIHYSGYEGVDIWMKGSLPREIPEAETYIGHSEGVNFILSRYETLPKAKFIFVNPLVRNRSLFVLFWHWIAFLLFEGIPKEKIVPLTNWAYAMEKAIGLLRIDVLEIIKKIPKEDIVVIRGTNDRYFCDSASGDLLRTAGIPFLEVDAGHDWNGNIGQAVDKITGSNAY